MVKKVKNKVVLLYGIADILQSGTKLGHLIVQSGNEAYDVEYPAHDDDHEYGADHIARPIDDAAPESVWRAGGTFTDLYELALYGV